MDWNDICGYGTNSILRNPSGIGVIVLTVLVVGGAGWLAPVCCFCVWLYRIGQLCVAMFCIIHTIPHHARGLLWLEHCIASMWYLCCDCVQWWNGMRVHDSMHGCGGMVYVCGVTVGLALCDGLDSQCVGTPSLCLIPVRRDVPVRGDGIMLW